MKHQDAVKKSNNFVAGMVVWDANKAYIKWRLVAFKANRNRKRECERTNIMTKIQELEVEVKQEALREGVLQLQAAYHARQVN